MARGKWEDFSDKYGFNDGDSVDTLDFAARDFLAKRLNEHPVMREKKLRAVAYDFAGVHNGARILVVKDEGPAQGKSRMEGDLPEGVTVVELPEELEGPVEDLVDASYDEAWDVLTKPRMRKPRQPQKKSSKKRRPSRTHL